MRDDVSPPLPSVQRSSTGPARCKHCGLIEADITGPCKMHSRGTHEIIQVTADLFATVDREEMPTPPPPPADPLMRALWDLENVVESAPALEPVSICTRAAALAAVHQALSLRDISHALEDIAHSLAREQFGIPEPIKNYGEPPAPRAIILSVPPRPEPLSCHHRENNRGVFTRCDKPAGHDGPHNHILERHPFEATRGAAYPDGRNVVLCHCERPARDGIHTCNTPTCNANLIPGHVHNCELGGPFPEPARCSRTGIYRGAFALTQCTRPAGHDGQHSFEEGAE